MHTSILRDRAFPIPAQSCKAALFLFTFSIAAVLWQTGAAASDLQSSNTATASPDPFKNVKVKVSIGAGFKPEYYEDAGWTSRVGLSLSAPLPSSWNVTVREKIEKQYSEESDAHPGDVYLKFDRTRPLAGDMFSGEIAMILDGTIAASPSSNERHLLGTSRVAVETSLTLLEPLSLTLGVDTTKYFFRETLSASGRSNPNYEMSGSAGLDASLPGSLTLGVSTSFGEQTLYSVSYPSYIAQVSAGEQHEYTYENSVDLTWAPKSKWSVSAGMTTGDDQLQGDGSRKPYVLYKADLTQMRVALTRNL